MSGALFATLLKPPDAWLTEHGYRLSNLKRSDELDAALIYTYEQEFGKLPPPNFAPGTKAYEQWTWTSEVHNGDPLDIVR